MTYLHSVKYYQCHSLDLQHVYMYGHVRPIAVHLRRYVHVGALALPAPDKQTELKQCRFMLRNSHIITSAHKL